jgi:hypothetical protein
MTYYLVVFRASRGHVTLKSYAVLIPITYFDLLSISVSPLYRNVDTKNVN